MELMGSAPSGKLDLKECDSTRNCCWMPNSLSWGGVCEKSACNFHYVLPQEFRLAFYVPSLDKVFLTAPSMRSGFRTSYSVNLHSDGSADLKDETGFFELGIFTQFLNFLSALFLTVFLELLVFIVYTYAGGNRAKFEGHRKKVLGTVVLVNVISLPLVWFGFPALISDFSLLLIVAEAFAVIFEALLLRFLNKELFSFSNAFWLSLFANITSFFVGGLIFVLFLYSRMF